MKTITYDLYRATDHDAVVTLLNFIADDRGPEVLAIANAKPSRVVRVARDGARTIGVIILALIEWSGDAHLRFLAVDAAYRSRGVGGALVAWARATATDAGMRRLYVDTSHDNVRGMQFYIRQGFIPEVCRFDFYKPGLHQVNLWLDLPYTGDARRGRGGSGRVARAGNAIAIAIDRYQESDRAVVVPLIDAITWQGDGLGVLDNALRNSSDWEIFVAHNGDAPVGTLLLHITRWNGTAHIGMLSVLPDDQGRGVGAALVGAATSLARERSLRRLTVGTGHANWRAQLFYLRNGFIPEICHHDFGGPGVHEVLLWQDI
ncbi:MAG: GNAT family N-acetyltransferase [Chloroflexota bacterium]|nr:GNAT family N-acetyltransferase [Chloroflexota bacterium]